MQRTLRARMLDKLIYLLNNTDIESLEYEFKQRSIKSEYTLLFTIILDKTVDIYYKGFIRGKNKKDEKKREALKLQLEKDYDTFLKHSQQFIDDDFLKNH